MARILIKNKNNGQVLMNKNINISIAYDGIKKTLRFISEDTNILNVDVSFEINESEINRALNPLKKP